MQCLPPCYDENIPVGFHAQWPHTISPPEVGTQLFQGTHNSDSDVQLRYPSHGDAGAD